MTQVDEEKAQLLKSGPISTRRRLSKPTVTIKETVLISPTIQKSSETSSKRGPKPKTPVELPQQDIIFKPNEGPQTDFLSATEPQVLYGGAAGGEPKSWFTASFPE